MVRLMRWMIGLMLTSISSSFRSQYADISGNQNKGKLAAKFKDIRIGDPGSQLYDESKQYANILDDSTNQGISPLRHLMELAENGTCIPPAIYDFPPDFMNQDQRSKGGIVIHFILALYACYGLAAICDIYFVPSLQLISERFGLSSDVAGATFMAAGTSSPELFESIIGSFVTEGDIGVGTIVGSAVFNILAVTGVCGLLAGKVVPLEWWPLSRDCAYYTVSVIALVVVIYDGKVFWYESMTLLIMFFIYVFVMRFNRKLSWFFHSLPCCNKNEEKKIDIYQSAAAIKAETTAMKQAAISIASEVTTSTHENGEYIQESDIANANHILLEENKIKPIEDELDENSEFYPCDRPEGFFKTCAYFITYPINLIFYLTVPNCTKERWANWYPFTFAMSVIYIGSLSYFVAWMVTIFGYTVGVPDTVMGITFLAIGTSIPEAYSSVIVCRKGFGNMAISNSVGSNIFDILFCLGLPWLIKATAFSDSGFVQINSSGLVYSAMSLLATVVVLFAVIVIFKFRLNVKVGITCFLIYIAFLIFASLVEMNIFGEFNPPSCVT